MEKQKTDGQKGLFVLFVQAIISLLLCSLRWFDFWIFEGASYFYLTLPITLVPGSVLLFFIGKWLFGFFRSMYRLIFS